MTDITIYSSDIQENSPSIHQATQSKLKRAYLAAPGLQWLLRPIAQKREPYGLLPSGAIYFNGGLEGNGILEILNKFKKCYEVHQWKARERLEMHIQYHSYSHLTSVSQDTLQIFDIDFLYSYIFSHLYLRLNQLNVLQSLTMENKYLFGDLQRLKIYSDTYCKDPFMVKHYSNPNMRDKDLEFLSKKLFTQLKSLRMLDLTLAACDKITDKGLETLGFGISHHLPNLTCLRTSIYDSLDMTDQGLKSWASQVCRYLLNLEALSLMLSNCPEITDEGFIALSSLICRRLTSLHRLELYFEGLEKVTDLGLQALIVDISQSMPNLKIFTLRFIRSPNVSDQGLEGIEGFLKDHSSKLHFLSLQFSEYANFCPNITDKALEGIICNIMIFQSNLRFLELDFARCPLLTDKSLGLLDLTRLPNLKHLVLKFNETEKITDETFQAISLKSLDSPLRLQQLDLDFSECIRITDKSLEAIGSLFKNSLLELTRTRVCFSMCEKITSEGIEALASGIKNPHKLLQSVLLQFNMQWNYTGFENKDKRALSSCAEGHHYVINLNNKENS